MDGKPRLGIVIVHIMRNVDVNTAERIHDPRKSVEVDHDILMNGDIKHLIDCPHHEWCTADGIDVRQACLAPILCHRHPRIARDIEHPHFARRVLHTDEQNRVRALFRHIIRIYRVVETKYKHIRIAVEAHIHRAAVLFLTHEICLIHIAHIAVCLHAPADQIVPRNRDANEQCKRKNQTEEPAYKRYAAAASPPAAAFLYVLA